MGGRRRLISCFMSGLKTLRARNTARDDMSSLAMSRSAVYTRLDIARIEKLDMPAIPIPDRLIVDSRPLRRLVL